MENENSQLNSTESSNGENQVVKQEKNPAEERQERVQVIDKEIKDFSNDKSMDVAEVEKQRNREFNLKKQEIENTGIQISEDDKSLIYKNIVEDQMDFAKKENERFDSLQIEKKKLILYNNLELGENPEISIDRAKKAIENQDEDGEKIKIFNEALEYYSKPQEKIAEVPVFHGTGSPALYNIIKQGALDSSKNIFGGEKSRTLKSHGGTSFAIGGYEESEIASHLYAKKADKDSILKIDRKRDFGDSRTSGEEILDVIHRQLPKLKPKERKFVEDELEKTSEERVKNLFDGESYAFDYNATFNELQESMEKLEGKRGHIDDEEYVKYLEGRVPYLKELVEGYNKLSEDERVILQNPYGILLSYEGIDLPKEDLEKFTTAGICERRTNKAIPNSKLKQIQAPAEKISQIKEWINEKIQSLPENSEGRKALEDVEIIPLEYYEVKSIIKTY